MAFLPPRLPPAISPLIRRRPPTCQQKTEETFATNAGRDLFFSAMTASTAIRLLDRPLGALPSPDDRFIAAERLKFFPSPAAASALLRYIAKAADADTLEDRVARRKAVESLGRHGGVHLAAEVVQVLTALLEDRDPYMVEVAVWALAEVAPGDAEVMRAVMGVLKNPEVEKRPVIRALLSGRYAPAAALIREFVEDADLATASAAMAAVAVLTGEKGVMQPVVEILKSGDLNVRRAAIDDISLARYTPALASVTVAPNSLVLRARAARILVDERRELDADTARVLDNLLWDHPADLDLLGLAKETRKARDPDRNIRQLYKNDAVYAYLASRTLAEDHAGCAVVGGKVAKSYNDLEYFDYFGAYHVYKTLGWLQYNDGFELLLDNAENLPPRFFNHQAGAITALAALGIVDALPVIRKVATETEIWEVKYACLLAAERLGDREVRNVLREDDDWLIRARAASDLDFEHLRDSFS